MDRPLLYEFRIPAEVYTRLRVHLMLYQPALHPETFVAELITRWLKVEEERIAYAEHGRSEPGLQWKQVFLPSGTTLRTCYQQATHYARVAGDQLIYEERVISPSAFANLGTRGRNAWRFVWVRFPGTDFWVRAADLRARQQAAWARQTASKHAGETENPGHF